MSKNKNMLDKTHPELAAQWHPSKNGDLTPAKVSCRSNKNVWWFLPYVDPETGTRFDFEWKETVRSRTGRAGRVFLSGRVVWSGFNDLVTKQSGVAVQRHPTKIGKLEQSMVVWGRKR